MNVKTQNELRRMARFSLLDWPNVSGDLPSPALPRCPPRVTYFNQLNQGYPVLGVQGSTFLRRRKRIFYVINRLFY